LKKEKDRLILNFIIVILFLILVGVVVWKSTLQPNKISIQRMKNGEFQLLVDEKPFFIRGIVYQPIPIGQNHQYNFWADPHQPWIEDGRLMQQLGVNSVRFFRPGPDAEQTRRVINQLYQLYGIRTILGHWMDYWRPGNYADPQYREALTKRVLEMVNTYKDEKGILMWILGNENNLSWHSGAHVPWSSPEVDKIHDVKEREVAKARIYYSLVNQIARQIKKIDPVHLVALGNADIYSLEVAKQVCPDIDLVALTVYRGKTFGNLWREVKRKIDKPVLIMEFGCDSFNAKEAKEDQPTQSAFLTSQWRDIELNRIGKGGVGNSLGGCIFEWSDEWWKHDENMAASWYVHNTEGDWSNGGFYFDIGAPSNLNVNEEWWGIVALSPEIENGINKRIPRQAYYDLQKLWKKD
jgi:beta-galactosidase/beta-glucuronidase